MTKYRSYIININFLIFRVHTETRVFKINNKGVHFILSFWYSLITVALGLLPSIFSFPFIKAGKTLEALRTNIGGGLEFDREMDELNYDEKTNYAWKNLLRTTTDKITKEELELIIDIQEEFKETDKLYSQENVNFVILNLGKIDIHRIKTAEITDIFDALKMYDDSVLEANIA